MSANTDSELSKGAENPSEKSAIGHLIKNVRGHYNFYYKLNGRKKRKTYRGSKSEVISKIKSFVKGREDANTWVITDKTGVEPSKLYFEVDEDIDTVDAKIAYRKDKGYILPFFKLITPSQKQLYSHFFRKII